MMFKLVIFILSFCFFPFQSLRSNPHIAVRNCASLPEFQQEIEAANQDYNSCFFDLSAKKSSLFQQTFFWNIDLEVDKDFKLDTLLEIYDLTIHLLYPNQGVYLDAYTSYADLPVQSHKFILFEQIKIPL